MKRKIFAFVLACVAGMVAFSSTGLLARAEGTEISQNSSYLTADSALSAQIGAQTRGVYLACGDSYISKISSYEIGAAGETTAASRCDVALVVIVERYNMSTDVWGFITSWSTSKEDALYVAIDKSLEVDSGYYYRVRSLHYAGTDASSSYTNALYVGN